MTQIANTVTVGDDGQNGPDPTPGNNTGTDTTPVTAAPDLTVSKSDGGVSTTAGGTVVYTISYSNVGNQGATGVVLTETVPANSTFNAGASAAGWSCVASTCTLNLGGVGAGASGSVAFAVTVNTPLPAGVQQIANTVTIADNGQNGPDPTPGNNTGTDTTPVTAAPDLTVSKSDGGATTVPGGTVAYTINYGNVGNQGATGVVLTETIPANSTFNAGGSTAGWSCGASTCTFTVGSLNAGASGSVTFAVTVVNPVPAGVTQLSNTVSIADNGQNGPDPTPANNTGTDTTPVTAAPDLTVSKSDGGVSTTVPGGTVAYTISYGNVGNQGATGVVLTETIPANSTFNAGGSTAGWSCGASTCTFTVGSLNAGASGSVTFAVTVVNPVAAGVTQLANTVSIADNGQNGPDPTPANNTGTDTTPVLATPDLTVTKSDGDVSTTPGGTVVYTISYSNVGNQGATGVVLTETVPANSTFNAGASAAGWSCVASTCTLNLGGVAAGANGSVAFAVTVNSPLPAGVHQIANTVTIADDGQNGADPTPGDNTGSDTTPIVAVPDLSVTKSDGGAQVAPAGTVAYTINYANNGSIGATGVTLTETIPANTTFAAASSSAGWTCGASTCSYTVGPLAAGASGSVTFGVHVGYPLDPGTDHVHNSVAITDDGTNGTDPDLSDNTGTDDTPVLGATVGDTVFFDSNANDAPDAGEGIAGATVTVTWSGPNGTLGDGDDIVTSTTTDANGQWSVTGLPTGLVGVAVVPPISGVTNSVDPDGGNDAASTLTLALGESRLDQDFGFVGTGSIGDTVFLDLDGDGVQDAGEPGVAGVTVTLLRDNNDDGTYETTVDSTTTDGSGHYSFGALYAAPYRVVVSVPAGYDSSSPTQVDHDLTAGESFDDADFAILGASIGDRTWNDLDGNGVQDAGEPGRAGVTVTLLDGDGATVATTTTDAGGAYSFDGLAAGNYEVQFGTVAGSVITIPDATSDGADSDAAVSDGRTGTFAVAAGATVTNVDAGYYATSSLQGLVFDDLDGDGAHGAGEPGLANVSMTLTGTDDLGTAVSLSTTTDANGNYSFPGLRAGTYTVTEAQPAGYLDGDDHAGTAGGTVTNDVISAITLAPGTDASGYTFAEFRAGSIGDTVFSDTDGDGVQDVGEPGLGGVLVALLLDADHNGSYETTVDTTTSAGTGTYAFDDLAPGDYRVVVVPPSGQTATTPTTIDITLASGDTRDDADFGFEPPAPPSPGSIGDRVWNDTDGDGAQDPGEAGVAGATVTLRLDADHDGSYETVAATQLTAADGSYTFGNLPPGSYQAVVTEPAGMNATTPTSVGVELSSGQIVTSADFGLRATPPAPGSIGDRVWSDTDADGVQDAGETGLSGVTVTLLEDTDGDGTFESTVATTTTAADGSYSFTDMPPGAYRVVVTPAAGTSPSTPTIVEVPLIAGQNVTDADFGLAPQPPAPGSIGDRVWSDSNHDGVQDARRGGHQRRNRDPSP